MQIRLKCVQTLSSIIQHPERAVSTPFIHAVAPSVIEYLLNLSKARPANDVEVMLAMESIKVLEALVGLTDDQNSKWL